MSATKGGFAPNLPSAEAGLDFVMRAIETAGFKPGTDMALALDCAATEFFKDGAYHYDGEGKVRSIEQQVDYLADLVAKRYPIVSIEDGMSEDDWARLEAFDRQDRHPLPTRRRRFCSSPTSSACPAASARPPRIPS